jgi:UDP-glucose:glycoprotein glucosyltransferase
MRPPHLLRRLLPISLILLGLDAASPPVKVALRSSWPAPPFLVEVMYVCTRCYCVHFIYSLYSESVALDNSDAFFPLLDTLTNPASTPSLHELAPEAVHQAALSMAVSSGYLNEPGSLAAVQASLALHAATPKIEAFYQHYGDRSVECGSWVDWYGEVICDVERLAHVAGVETLDSSNETLPHA